MFLAQPKGHLDLDSHMHLVLVLCQMVSSNGTTAAGEDLKLVLQATIFLGALILQLEILVTQKLTCFTSTPLLLVMDRRNGE